MLLDYIKRFFTFLSSIALLILVWHFGAHFSSLSELLMPTPYSVTLALGELFTDGRLFEHVLISFKRFFIGYALACTVAMVLGIVFGRINILWKLIQPIVLLLKPISPIAWLPFIMLWFGIGDPPAIFTIALASFFPMLMATVRSVADVNASYMRVAADFGLSRTQELYMIILPAAFPHLITGLHTALTAAWIFLVAGELMGTYSGLGFLINDARQNMRSDLIMAGIVLIGTVGYLLDRGLATIESVARKKWGL